MNKRQIILGLKKPSEFNLSERQQIVEEYLLAKCKKRDVWKKYTGEKEERGQILRWMRQLGYEIEPKYSKLAINKTVIYDMKFRKFKYARKKILHSTTVL